MKWMLIGLVTLFCLYAEEEKRVSSRVLSVQMFKNGIAVVQREIELSGAGTYYLTELPEPIHGTFWIESNAKVVTQYTQRMVEVLPHEISTENFQESLAGKQVLIHLHDEKIPPIEGTILSTTSQKEWSRVYQPNRPNHPYEHYYPQLGYQTTSTSKNVLLIETATSIIYLDSSKIAYLAVLDKKGSFTKKLPVLLFQVEPVEETPAKIHISYLTKGIAWAPSYAIDISNPKILNIQQKAVIKNELESFSNVEMSLISGFPGIQFSHVSSPLSLRTNWASFFNQLNATPGRSHSSSLNVVSQQALTSNFASNATSADTSAIPQGEGVDLHYQNIGSYSLAEGDSLAVQIASAQAEYERIIEWVIPDTRNAYGQMVRDYEWNQNPEKYEDATWDALRFKNPFSFPMTTGPVQISAKGRFNGQSMTTWVNVGEETILRITKALSIRTRQTEYEEEGQREVLNLGGRNFRKTVVKGEILANNHRNEIVTLLIRRQFSGELLQAERSPKTMLLEEGVYSVNKRNQLTWTITLKPGEEVKLGYRYNVLVAH